jgi:ferredoxin/flavodoxin
MSVVRIAYFSGTGGTAKAAHCFESEFASRGLETDIQQIKAGKAIPNGDETLLVLLFAVHALNAPLPVYQWLENMEPVNRIPALVISVSGGGEMFPNTACRQSSIKRLERKCYEVVYEQMLIMPSNVSVATPDFLSTKLLMVLPKKVKDITDEVLCGFKRRTKPKGIDQILARIFEIEKRGAKRFGRGLSASQACTGCGWCERNCSGSSIRIENNRPVFGGGCVMCFGCVYGCPAKAIKAGKLGFFINKKGFDINLIEKIGDVPDQKTGVLWKAVRRYIEED